MGGGFLPGPTGVVKTVSSSGDVFKPLFDHFVSPSFVSPSQTCTGPEQSPPGGQREGSVKTLHAYWLWFVPSATTKQVFVVIFGICLRGILLFKYCGGNNSFKIRFKHRQTKDTLESAFTRPANVCGSDQNNMITTGTEKPFVCCPATKYPISAAES